MIATIISHFAAFELVVTCGRTEYKAQVYQLQAGTTWHLLCFPTDKIRLDFLTFSHVFVSLRFITGTNKLISLPKECRRVVVPT